MKKFLKFVVGVAAVAGSVAGVLYFWDKRKTDLEEDDFDDDFDDIFEEEGTEAKEESTETSKEE